MQKNVRKRKQMNKLSANKLRILRNEERKLAKHPFREIYSAFIGQQPISTK